MKNLRKFFNLSSREYRATVLIVILLFVLTAARLIIPYIQQNSTIDFSNFKNEILQFEATAYSDTTTFDNNYVSNFSKDSKVEFSSSELFYFDPNTADSNTFLKLGLSPKQTKVICNYRRKGGRFYNKSSFKKMYCITPKMYQKLEPYIAIPSLTNNKIDDAIIKLDTPSTSKKTHQYKKEDNVLVEINDADTTALKRIKGIGSAFAKRIIAYREKLGGFIRKKQLMEIYGIDTTIYIAIEKHIVIDSANIKKININQVGFYTLKNFPYLKQSQVSALLNYRDKHGKFAKPTDIKKCVLIDEETFNKIKAYIQISD